MTKLAYVNGLFLPHAHAYVGIEDRALQFADGVYEIISYVDGRPLDKQKHLDRLNYSLGELRIDWPMKRCALEMKIDQLVRQNRLREGLLYLQVTRGVAPRNHAFPRPKVKPSLIMTTKNMKLRHNPLIGKGARIITTKDIRWQRCDIKTVNLLANCLAKEEAVKAGADEAWFIDDNGFVKEGSSTNAWIINHKDELITRPLGKGAILAGITRDTLMELVHHTHLKLIERAFSLEEAYQAKEAFYTAASSFMIPIIAINERQVGEGKPGPLVGLMRQAYLDRLLPS